MLKGLRPPSGHGNPIPHGYTKGNEDIATLLSIRLQLPQAVADDALVSKYGIL